MNNSLALNELLETLLDANRPKVNNKQRHDYITYALGIARCLYLITIDKDDNEK